MPQNAVWAFRRVTVCDNENDSEGHQAQNHKRGMISLGEEFKNVDYEMAVTRIWVGWPAGRTREILIRGYEA